MVSYIHTNLPVNAIEKKKKKKKSHSQTPLFSHAYLQYHSKRSHLIPFLWPAYLPARFIVLTLIYQEHKEALDICHDWAIASKTSKGHFRVSTFNFLSKLFIYYTRIRNIKKNYWRELHWRVFSLYWEA